GPRRGVATGPDLLPALALQAQAGGRSAQMTAPLLAIDKLEVVYQRAITALQGISLTVASGQIVGILGTNGAGKSTLLRAISGFHGIDDAEVTEGAITFRERRIEAGQPHANNRLGIAL